MIKKTQTIVAMTKVIWNSFNISELLGYPFDKKVDLNVVFII